MNVISQSNIRKNFKEVCDDVHDNNEVVIVSRKEDKNVVIISLDEYNQFLKDRNNAEYLAMLDMSFEQLERGETVTFTIDELGKMLDA